MHAIPWMLPTLYKASGKKVQSWTIVTWEYPNGTAYTEVTHGQVGGKMQTTCVQYTKGKNIGRANETTPAQQAKSEALSKWNKQKDGGYTEDPSGKGAREAPLPMLAHTYGDYAHKVTFPCFIQPKLDGMRCLAVKTNGKVLLWSRKGKPIETMPHIQNALEYIMDDGEIFDGELYAHGIPFQQQISWFKKFDRDNHIKVSYHVYDMVDENQTFSERWEMIIARLEDQAVQKRIAGAVVPVITAYIDEVEHILKAHKYYTERGYEGVMLRHGDCRYTPNKRSQQLLKVKEWIDAEFLIVGAVENIGKMEGTCTFILQTDKGSTFNCTPVGTQGERRQYWEDYKQGNLTGKMMTARFFQWSDSDPPVPRFPTGIGIRDYE